MVKPNKLRPERKKDAGSKKRGIDALLTSRGKTLAIGQEIRFTLVKGPNNPLAPDPVNPNAPHEQFPQVAKFPESVVKPDFQSSSGPWNAARMYQQDVPKALDDSDDEAEQAKNPQKQRRWRSRRKEAPKRQWILQEQVGEYVFLLAQLTCYHSV